VNLRVVTFLQHCLSEQKSHKVTNRGLSARDYSPGGIRAALSGTLISNQSDLLETHVNQFLRKLKVDNLLDVHTVFTPNRKWAFFFLIHLFFRWAM
jgi:hypothetical protein